MNLSRFKGNIGTSIRRNLLSRQENVDKNISSNFESRACQCDEASLIIPNLKVSIIKRISERHGKPNSSCTSNLSFIKPSQPETFIKVKSIISRPLIINKNKSLIAFAKENVRTSASCIRKSRRICKGSVFTKEALNKAKPASFY